MTIEDQIGAIASQFVVGIASLCEVVPSFSLDAIAIQVFEWFCLLLSACLMDACETNLMKLLASLCLRFVARVSM